MRRKVITMLVTLGILALLGAVEQIAVHRITGDALGATRNILQHVRAGELEAALQKAHALDEAWDERAGLLETIVDHRSTDDVRYALSRLLAALEGGDQAAALIYAGELEGGVEHVLERQVVSAQNLL